MNTENTTAKGRSGDKSQWYASAMLKMILLPANLERHRSLGQAPSAGIEYWCWRRNYFYLVWFFFFFSFKTGIKSQFQGIAPFCSSLYFWSDQVCGVHGDARGLCVEQRSLPRGAPSLHAGRQPCVDQGDDCAAGIGGQPGFESAGVGQPAIWPPWPGH